VIGYNDAQGIYLAAGWRGVLPLPARAKKPPPEGFTGNGALDPDDEQLQRWRIEHPNGNLALRLPPDVIGLDVDAYDGKPGAETLTALEAQLGPLPPTWASTSRNDGVSSIRFYRVPSGRAWRSPGRGIDLIHTGHRYVVAPWSTHPEGRPYRWIAPDGRDSDQPPKPDELPELPPAWLARLDAGEARTYLSHEVELDAWLEHVAPKGECSIMSDSLARHEANVRAGAGRHDAMNAGVQALVSLAVHGHKGGLTALQELGRAFHEVTTDRSTFGELQRSVQGALEKAGASVYWQPPPCGHDEPKPEATAEPERFALSTHQRPATFFAPKEVGGGLLVEKLAHSILAKRPCALTPEGNVAVYSNGVYRIDREALNAEVAVRLRDRYRPSHRAAVEGFTTATLYNRPDGRLPAHSPVPVLNTRNTMVDLKTGATMPHDPSYLSSVQIPVEWNPDASCPCYLAWAKAIGIADVLEDLEEVCSTMLDPSRTPRKAGFLYGPTRSGKSTYLRLMAAIAGTENTSAVTLHTLAEGGFASAHLYNKILNAAADLSDKHVQDLSLFKLMTGEDPIDADRKWGHRFTYVNRALFLFSANDVPTVSEASQAYAERIKPFKFGVSFAGRESPVIEDHMMTELPGILVRLVKAWQRMAGRGGYQATAVEIRRDFDTQSNRVFQWFSECCSLAELPAETAAVAEPKLPAGQAATATAIAASFNDWARVNHLAPMGRNKIISRLTSVDGIERVRIGEGGVRGYNIILDRSQ
jgi:P4 family phage/plasmid primase-like protien